MRVYLLGLLSLSSVVDALVVINEFVINDGTGSGAQWIELYNREETSVNMSGGYMEVGGINGFVFHYFDADDVIEGKGYFVVGNTAAQSNPSLRVDTTHSTLVLSSDGGNGMGAAVGPEPLLGYDYVYWDSTEPLAPLIGSWARVDVLDLGYLWSNWRGGTVPTPRVCNVVSVCPVVPPAVSSLTLIHADTNAVIATLSNATTVRRRDMRPRMSGSAFNIVANVTNATTVESVVFWRNGTKINTEFTAPYAMCGNRDRDIWSCGSKLGCGHHVVTAVPYANASTAGTPLTVAFTIVC